MATFDVAKLLNKITQDIPGINTVLKALAKWDVSALTDVPDGAMQATTDTNNRLTIKKKVSDSYTPVAKLMHDVDLLDGYHASASATANTVAVRNAQGALPGNITGNAATAATAVALAAGSVVPLNQGGTEATTASQARANLGAAGSADFTAHIAKQASSSVEGHVKLSDAVNSTSGVAGGIAATPAAAKSAYDRASLGVTNAAAAQSTADTAVTKANAAQTSANNAQTTATAAKAVTDKVSTTPAAGKIPLAGSDGKIDKDWLEIPSGMPIGSIFSHLCSSTFTPEGCLPVNGAEYTKAQFSDFYTNYLASGKLLTCTYAQYSTAVSTYGACAKFALDTTNLKFKVPLIPDGESITQAMSDAQLGVGLNAGLPSITGSVNFRAGYYTMLSTATGAFTIANSGSSESYRASGSQGTDQMLLFDPSASSSIYGNSTTVQPPQVRLRHFVVVANGTINQSMMDWSAWATGLAGKANTDLSNCTKPYITETWKSSDGSGWYRKYSDGYIEQGGTILFTKTTSGRPVEQIITLGTPFLTTRYAPLVTVENSDTYYNGYYVYYISGSEKTTTTFAIKCTGITTDQTIDCVSWKACGY